MRVGRLQQQTLENIWKSLEPGSVYDIYCGIDRVQKYYIPTRADSPLYQLPTTDISEVPVEREELEVGDDILPIVMNTPLTQRGSSLPNIRTDNELDEHLPLPRVVQSASDLFDNNMGSSRQRVTGDRIHSRAEISTTSHRETPLQSHAPRVHVPRSRTNTKDKDETINQEASLKIEKTENRENNLKMNQSWIDEYSHIDIDWSMQVMDILYNASFYDYIRDEKNFELSAIRLCRIVKDYKPRQVANALTWMTQGWSLESTGKLLRVVFADWLPDLAGCVYGLISRGWPKAPECALCAACILIEEPVTSASLFIRSLTHGWSTSDGIELITYLTSVLMWDADYLQEIVMAFAVHVTDTEPKALHDSITRNTSDQELVKAAKKLLSANSRLQMAEYQLSIYSHWSTCGECQGGGECAVLQTIKEPSLLTSDSDVEFARDSSQEQLSHQSSVPDFKSML